MADNPLQELWNCLKSDMDRYFHTGFRKAQKEINKTKIVIETIVFKAGYHALLLYRISHFFYRIKLSYIAWFIQRLNVWLTGAEIEYNVEAGPGLFIAHPVGIVIGRGSKIGNRVTVYQNVTLGARHTDSVRIFKFPVIEDEVTIYAGAVIVGDVLIGTRSIVGANAVVLENIPPDSSAVGNPAKAIQKKENIPTHEKI